MEEVQEVEEVGQDLEEGQALEVVKAQVGQDLDLVGLGLGLELEFLV